MRHTIVLLFLVALGCSSPAQPVSTRAALDASWPDPTVTDPAKQALAEQMAQGFQGAYLVAEHGRVLAAGGRGSANWVTGEPNGVETRFRLASVTKPLTAIAVMQLVEQGLLDLDGVVTDYLPAYGAKGNQIEVRHLLGHTSGIPDYVGSVGDVSSPAELVDVFRSWPLKFTPGSKFSYSNSNYALLGYLIEEVTGRTYADYMQTEVFDRAHMTGAGFAFPSDPGPGFAAPSGGNPDGPFEPNNKAYAAGALYASVSDMFFWNHALYAGLLVQADSLAAMHTAGKGGYGLGFAIHDGHVGHNGVIPGFTSQMYSFPETEGLVMVFSNGGGSTGLANQLVDLIDGPTAAAATAVTVYAAVAEDGRYDRHRLYVSAPAATASVTMCEPNARSACDAGGEWRPMVVATGPAGRRWFVSEHEPLLFDEKLVELRVTSTSGQVRHEVLRLDQTAMTATSDLSDPYVGDAAPTASLVGEPCVFAFSPVPAAGWNGERGSTYPSHRTSRDYHIPMHTPLYAMGTCETTKRYDTPDEHPCGHGIAMRCLLDGQVMGVLYCHLDAPAVDKQHFGIGELVGTSGNSGTQSPHLHLGLTTEIPAAESTRVIDDEDLLRPGLPVAQANPDKWLRVHDCYRDPAPGSPVAPVGGRRFRDVSDWTSVPDGWDGLSFHGTAAWQIDGTIP